MSIALIIQHVKYMRHIVISGLSGSTIFLHILTNGAIFGGKKIFNIKCVFWFSLQLLSETFLILRRTERDMIVNVYWSPCKDPIIFVGFQWNSNYRDRFFEYYSNAKFHRNPSSVSRIVPCGRIDRQTGISYLLMQIGNAILVECVLVLLRDLLGWSCLGLLTLWRRNYFFNFSTPCI